MPAIGQGPAQLVGVPPGPGAQNGDVHHDDSIVQAGLKTRLYAVYRVDLAGSFDV